MTNFSIVKAKYEKGKFSVPWELKCEWSTRQALTVEADLHSQPCSKSGFKGFQSLIEKWQGHP